MGKHPDPPDVKELKVRNRKLHAIELRKAGWNHTQIAQELRVKQQTVAKWIREELQALREECQESIMEMIEIESLRYDALLKAFWDDAIKHRNFKAADIILRIWERKAKLLGLDAPEKQAVMNIEATSQMTELELIEEAKRLGFSIPTIAQYKEQANLIEAPLKGEQ